MILEQKGRSVPPYFQWFFNLDLFVILKKSPQLRTNNYHVHTSD